MRAEKKHGDASLVPPTRSPFSPPPPRAFPVSPLPSPLLPPPQKWIVATEKRVHPSARAAATALESVGRSQGERKTFVTRVLQAMLAQRYRVSNQESERVWRRVLAGILNRLTTTTKSAVPSHAYHLAACADSVPSASSAASSHACPVESAAATAASGSLAAPPPPRASWVSPLPSRILPPPPKWLVVNEEGGHPTAPVAATPVAVQKSFFAGAPAGAGAKLGSTGQTDEERRAVYSWVLKTLRERQARAGNQGSDESGQPDLGGTLNPKYPITATNGAVPGHACDSGPFPYFVPSASLASSLHACLMGSAAATASSGSLDAPPPSPYIHPPIFAARPPPSSASSASALAWPEWPRASSSGSEPLQVHFRVKWKQGAHRNICVALVAKCQELAWSPLAPLFSSPAYSRRSVACQSSSFASSSPPLSPSCSFGEAPKSLCSLSTVASLGPPAASAPFAGSARPSQSSSSAFLVSSRLPLLLKQVAPRDGAEDEWTSDPLLLQSVAPGHVVPFVFLLWDTEKGGPARIEPVPDRRWFALPRARGSYTIDAGAFQDARGGQAAVYPTPPPVNRGPWDMAFDDEF
ncbi:hypothetical protein BESB_070810 [Besnoitia besnoiti]|uniref:Uncharacterized protein n=1 Tax=Besnoitia besnoiti TaxID=94643 RepID=A0A2A9M7L6_BESBE|nr:uncharacterized protein BESB_070810 [Besnoitia besnoiti]PFH33929.1 hypothetical protein BESB_070810 [Besnoitia besnoiti]